ncbi:NucA/NucB deoxyribonuclease domain-containing protein [Streptomyces sp. H27-D2]|uniref:NucA/NucB deoxyribonuclease domain-containing protein n=1 Tax=Streptomyces sp. H27-D2 TaxID=3046304 RepID=UPI002DB6206D|nr:NucA/NucB deoxyribonuclease domain-containing protein [Streptomyces sp. H27-D2]MEC4018300.1 NucA/NucB deoxyribonuclease domain-containing protein [Streptomyces sp. H27-D2]
MILRLARAAAATVAAFAVAATCMGAAQTAPARLTLQVTESPVVAAAGIDTCQVNSIRYNRYEECQSVRATVRVLRNSAEVGRATFTVTHHMKLSQKSLKWAETVHVSRAALVGNAAGIRTKLSASCGSPCKATTHVPAHTLGSAFSGTVKYVDGVRKNKTHGATSKYAYTFVKAGFTPGGFSYKSLNFRCDDTFWNRANTVRTLKAGCVFPKYSPTLTTMSQLPDIANNIRRIQAQGGHYGKPGSGHALRRLTDARKAAANRRAVCRGTAPRPGLSCDEYPFASTYEGGTTLPAGSRGIAWVPEGQQDQQGGRLSAFYKKDRVLDHDSYWVAV